MLAIVKKKQRNTLIIRFVVINSPPNTHVLPPAGRHVVCFCDHKSFFQINNRV